MSMVHDAHSAMVAAKVCELLRECDEVLKHHHAAAERMVYGSSLWTEALQWDLSAVRAKLVRVGNLVCGAENPMLTDSGMSFGSATQQPQGLSGCGQAYSPTHKRGESVDNENGVFVG